ncbi:MAG TPA: type VI secretion system contractile sheath large subunit [Pyrinomonadaceae bacterium]|nr:type VI secretion system contractile sheath large subunit [Pyrinomonadaceae bacterium]
MSTTAPETVLQTKLRAFQDDDLKTKLIRDISQAKQAMNALSELIAEVDAGTIAKPTPDTDLVGVINQRIAALDQEIDDGLNKVMHSDSFRRLESSWRGLHYLVSRAETGTMLKLRLLNATKAEIQKDLERAVEFDQSVQFKKIYEEEYGTFGGSPYSVLVGDYEFDRTPQDIKWLEKMSNVAAAAHAPFIAAASPGLFDMDTFEDLGNPRDLAKGFESSELVSWRAFRDSEDSRYVALCMPHFLLRQPYGKDVRRDVQTGEDKKERITGRIPTDEVAFQEEVNGDRRMYCWGNAAYAMAERITNAFSLFKWTAAIRGVEGGGLVEGLPAVNFKTDEGDVVLKCPTELAITDRREKELNDLGFIALVHRKNSSEAAFFGGQTTQKPKVYQDPQATANARLSSQLPYIMAASRFAHYIKSMMRDKVGSFMTKENVADYLNKWIADYVLLDDRASQSSKASFPLREARIDVEDVVGKPGVYKAVVYLRPHFQLDELTASIRLVAELPQPVAA